jgi:DNA topoisomerase-1
MQNGKSEHEEIAALSRSGLVYVSDTEPGIRRRRRGAGFSYLMAGEPVRDADTLERIRTLAIPPAWTDVWICTDPQGHLQATGRDDRGRKQYRYHSGWTATREEAKFSTLPEFARALPGLRKQVDLDLKRRGMPRERVIASIVWLLDNTLIRIGNDSYARENRTFGLTTLRSRHLTIEGPSLRFSFVGKSGREWRLHLRDRRVASVVRTIQDLPGQRLFQYRGPDGMLHDIHSQDVNGYIREVAGDDFTSKHFRTWGATVLAASLLADTPVPPARRTRARILNAAIDVVAERLRNTRAVCRSGYIHPAVIEAWESGTLLAELQAAGPANRALKGLSREESMVLRWLSRRDCKTERPKKAKSARG